MAAYNFPASREYAMSLVEARAAESPAARCAVINCNSAASDGNEYVKFYPFPDDPAERMVWVQLLGRVDRSRKPWHIQRSNVHYVCSKHFLGNRRLLIRATDHYYPSIFPAINIEHCVSNARPEEEKCAAFPRAAGFYKHRRIPKEGPLQNGTGISVYRDTLPELDEEGLKWSQLQDLAYKEIYLPFTEEFNNLISEIRLQDKKTLPKVSEITKRMENLRLRLNTSSQRMAERNRLAQTEINIYSPGHHQIEQNRTSLPSRSRILDRPPGRTKMHSFVLGQDDIRIPIDVTMPSIQKDWTSLQMKQLRGGEKVFALDSSGNWVQSVVLDVAYDVSYVKVKIQNTTKDLCMSLAKVAYGCPSPTQIPLGCRVVAGNTSRESGVVMEYPKWQNSNRYLILFEDGRWAYHDHVSIFLICKQTSQNWQHVDQSIRQIVKEFFMTTEHPLLRAAVGQKICAEKDSQWFDSQVVALDGNLIQVAFYHYGQRFANEWLYAGSTRLQEIFNLKHPTPSSTRKHAKRTVGRKANGPYVEYTDDAMDVITLSDDEDDQDDARNQKKNTARKSTAQPPPRKKTLNSAVVKDPGFLGSVEKDVVEPLAKPKHFVPHTCGPACLPVNEDPSKFTAHSPYLLPHIMAFSRVILQSGDERCVLYRAPCGKSLRDETEAFHYLLLTGSKIRIDQFCFDPEFDVYAVWKPEFQKVFIPDITKGEEPYPISFVNAIDNVDEELVPYWSKRRPTKAAKQTMILDEEFLPCCSCEDECLDRSKCQCQSQTIAVSDAISGEIDQTAGYTLRSLLDPQLTGIYECNSRCSCMAQCINKVAQSGVQIRMQLFKTLKKGLGVRTLHDIPKGRFLCTYAGTILTDTEAEACAQDTYFANLDYIDIVVQTKEGYESSTSDIEDDSYAPDDESDEEVIPKRQDDRDTSRQLHFGKGDCYVMDALKGGNIGRYFNHSCDPNIFVQNVFVDTHDLRLPWLGFFTDRLVKAGEELTWDYRYEVGSVRGKKLLCYCNSTNCRKRLL